MIFHYASNTGLDAITVGFAVCATVSPLMIGAVSYTHLGVESLEHIVRKNNGYDTTEYGRLFIECIGEEADQLYRKRFHQFHIECK